MSEHPDYDRMLKLLWCIAKQAGGQIEVYYQTFKSMPVATGGVEFVVDRTRDMLVIKAHDDVK